MTGVTPSAARRRAERETAPPVADDPPVENARLYNQPTSALTRKMKWGAISYALAMLAISAANYQWPGVVSTEAALGIAGAISLTTGYRVRERV